MSYGFIFPKQGYSVNGEVKDMAWRDDQKIFLIREPVTTNFTIPSGTNLDTMSLETSFNVNPDFYIYKSFITINNITRIADSNDWMSIGGISGIIDSKLVVGDSNVTVKITFNKYPGSGNTTSEANIYTTVYLALQTLT